MKKVDLACIIDDDPIYIFGIKRVLEIGKICNETLVFNNGKDAFDKLSELHHTGAELPDLILLDLNMPVWDGWYFLDEFSRIPLEKKVMIYIVSSSIDPADIKRAKFYDEVDTFVIKPVTLDKLRTLLTA